MQREDGKDDKQEGGGQVKWILVTYNKLIVIYEVFKYLSSIDEELVMPMLQDLDREPRLPCKFENLHIWGFSATTDGSEDQPLGLHLDPDKLSPNLGIVASGSLLQG